MANSMSSYQNQDFTRCLDSGRQRISMAGSQLFQSICVLLLCLLPMASASAIDISEHRWGFNGKVAAHRFNLLTVLVNNPTPQTFTGQIVLKKTLGGASSVDAPIVEQVTVSPNSRKWVQFYPYITSENNYSGSINEVWRLTYPGGYFEVPPPRLAKYQRIILDDPNSVMSRDSGAVKFHFPDNLFPPFVSATDALQFVAIDHVPRWEEARRQSFMDWIYLGGTVLVLQEPNGKFPEFSGDLAPLKSPLEDQPFGSGRIVRLAQTRSLLQESDYLRITANLPRNFVMPVRTGEGGSTDDILDKLDESTRATAGENLNYQEISDPYQSGVFLSELKDMSKPKHNWLLLHLLFWIYIVMIFPGCYLLGKKWTDFRIVYAGLLGTVVIFSVLFSIVGARGYGESTAVHTVAIARPLPNDQMDVTQWSNVFVTSGADYKIQYDAAGSLFSTCNDHEQVKGIINNGSDGSFQVDIPPFSDRELTMRGRISSPAPKLTLETSKIENERLAEFSLNVEGLDPSEVESQFVLVDKIVYGLKWDAEKLVLSHEVGTLPNFLQIAQKRNFHYRRSYTGRNEPLGVDQRYRELADLLIARGLNISREKDADEYRPTPGIFKVLLFAKEPSSIMMHKDQLKNQIGRVLYVIPLNSAVSQ